MVPVIVNSVSRAGKVAVDVILAPSDAELSVNNQVIKDSDAELYLEPGDYIFKAKKDGFVDYENRQTISEDNKKVSIVLESKGGKLSEDDTKKVKEKLDADMKDINEKNPLIKFLPKINIPAPYRIDYGPYPDDSNRMFILISYSTPDGRAKAVQWIRSTGVDPTTLDIRYKDSDFINPLFNEVD